MSGFWVYERVSGERHEARTAGEDDFVKEYSSEHEARKKIGEHNVSLFETLQQSGQLLIGLTLLQDEP